MTDDELAREALDAARAAGAAWAQVRLVHERTRSLSLRNGEIADGGDGDEAGLGLRVRTADGFEGFAATSDRTVAGVTEAAQRAARLARATATLPHAAAHWRDREPVTGTWRTPVMRDPSDVSTEERAALLRAIDDRWHRWDALRLRTASVADRRTATLLVDSDGSRIEQEQCVVSAGMRVLATRDTETQVRSWPNSFGGQHVAAGWEAIDALRMDERAEDVANEVYDLLYAAPCPEGSFDLILDSSQLALQIHESIGHAAEADRLFGHEASHAGGTWLQPELVGASVASPLVTITADMSAPGGLGTVGWDDEGAPAEDVTLVDGGVFRGWLGNRGLRERMPDATLAPAARAMSWFGMPLVRMTNVSLRPGSGTLENLIENTEHAIYMETNASWSIDERRLAFQFGCERAWEIRDGQRVRLLRNPAYAGVSPSFWRSCDAVTGTPEWKLWGLLNCGKGQPGQLMRVSHGASPARFRGVRVFPSRPA